MYCVSCGKEMANGAKYCSSCGARNGRAAGESNEDVSRDDCFKNGGVSNVNEPVPMMRAASAKREAEGKGIPRSVLIGVVVAIAAFAVGVGIIATGASVSTVDFARRYNDIALESFCEIAEDGSYMKIDTNPFDFEDEIMLDAWYAIERINDELGFPDSVMERMSETRSLDGVQEAEAEGVRASWTYHPDNGLEVMYELTLE